MKPHYVYFRCWPGFAPAFPSDRFNHLADDEIEPELLKCVREMREHDESVARAFKLSKSLTTFRPMQRDLLTGEPLPPPPKVERRQATPQEEILLIARAAGWTERIFARYEGLEDSLWTPRQFVHVVSTSAGAARACADLQESFQLHELVPRFGIIKAGDLTRVFQAKAEVLIKDLRIEESPLWLESNPLKPLAKVVAKIADTLDELSQQEGQAGVPATQKEVNKAVWRYLMSQHFAPEITSQQIAEGLGIPGRDSMVRKSPAWKEYYGKSPKKARRVPFEATSGRPNPSSDSDGVLDDLAKQEASEPTSGHPDQPCDNESRINDLIEKQDWPAVESAQEKEERRQTLHDVPQPRLR